MKAPCAIGATKYSMISRYTNVHFDSKQMKLVNDNPCPALKFDGEHYSCIHAEEYREELAIGAGCSSGLNSQRSAKIKRTIHE